MRRLWAAATLGALLSVCGTLAAPGTARAGTSTDACSDGTVLDGSGALAEGVTPARLVDTRGGRTVDGQGPAGALAPGAVLDVQVAGRGGVPA